MNKYTKHKREYKKHLIEFSRCEEGVHKPSIRVKGSDSSEFLNLVTLS